MKSHTSIVSPSLALALTPQEKSASACRVALRAVSVSVVARQLELTDGRVRQWRRAGEGSPSLVQIFEAPEFGAALLASVPLYLGPGRRLDLPVRERLYVAMVALGDLTRASAGKRDLSDYSSEELLEQSRRARDLEREGKAIADACEEELLRRRQAPAEDKGAR